jgi:hypothetical protein
MGRVTASRYPPIVTAPLIAAESDPDSAPHTVQPDVVATLSGSAPTGRLAEDGDFEGARLDSVGGARILDALVVWDHDYGGDA